MIGWMIFVKRSHRVWLRVVTATCGLLVALGLAEAAVRVIAFHPRPIKVYSLAADNSGSPLGSRERLASLPPNPALVRIAFVGDSFTYGLGVEANQAFPRVAGELLNQRFPGRYATINLGVDGNDLISDWAIINHVRDLLRPQVVVQVMSPNDLDIDLYKGLLPIRGILAGRLWPSRYSRLFELAEARLRVAIAYRRSLDYLQGGATQWQQDRSWRIASHEIEAAKRLVEAGGAVYVLVRFPFLLDLRCNPIAESHRRTAEVAERLGITYLDLFEVFGGRDSTAMPLPDDDHPSAAAHRVAAEAIVDFLTGAVFPRLGAAPAGAPSTARSFAQVTADEIRHDREILEIDPTCYSAEFWLAKAMLRQPHP
jgi:lysophospholipase L1-like esterase